MTKRWGAIAVIFASTNAIAGTVPAPKLCSEYLQPKNWQPLSALPKDAIDIQADDVEMQGKDSAEFSGNVVINTSKMSLQASSALIDKKQSLLNATGPLNYQDPYTNVSANALYADLNNNEISLLGADYQLTQQQGHGGAEKLSASDKQVALINSSFTTCPSNKPFWALEADNITLSKEEGWGETHNAVLKILDAPVLYVPYFTFPIDDRRKSGLLMPKIAPSSRYGLEVALPYYWNIAPNYDATITPRYMANQGVQLITEFRYLTEQHKGLLGVEFLEQDDSEPSLDERYLVHWDQQSYLSEQWRMSVDVTNVSDDNYLTDLNSDYANETGTQLDRTGVLSYLGSHWLTDIKLQTFEVLGDHTESYAALPQISWRNRSAYNLYGLDFDVHGELAHFKNDALQVKEATRFHIEPKASFKFNEYAWSFISELSLLHTRYKQKGDLQNTPYDENVSRTLPKLRMHAQLNFERDTAMFIKDGIQTLEPQVQYLYTPDRNQQNIALYDTTKMQDDFYGLFRDQRFSGVDRIAEANQITLGATTRIFDAKSQERFNFSAGQILYLEDDVKPSAQSLDNQTNYNALFAAETMIHWHRRWYFSAGVQYDADAKEIIESHTTIDYKGDKNKLVQLNHRYASDVSGYEIDQVGLFTSLPINENWQMVASYHRDLTTARSVEVFAGVRYESCCWAIQVTGKRQIETDLNRTINQDVKFDSSIDISFVLKGLGGKSKYDINKVLQQGLFHYRRPYFLNN